MGRPQAKTRTVSLMRRARWHRTFAVMKDSRHQPPSALCDTIPFQSATSPLAEAAAGEAGSRRRSGNGSRFHDPGDLLPDPLGRRLDLPVSEVGVAERHADVGMTEQPRDHRHRHRVHHRVAGVRVPEIVKPDVLDAGLAPDPGPGTRAKARGRAAATGRSGTGIPRGLLPGAGVRGCSGRGC